jgi:phosphoribosylcarboxyaminoimidazole (NCAIR) mutase
MSSLKQSTTLYNESNLYIDEKNYDPMDTLAPIIQMDNFPKGTVADTPENRANAALACCAQLTRQLRALKNRVYELEHGTAN